MKVVFLGVGDASDEIMLHNSHLIESETNLLLDCGAFAPINLRRYNDNIEFLDAVYISHLHADHYFGLASLIIIMHDSKREKPLTIICQKGSIEQIKKIITMGYPNTIQKLKFDLNFIEVDKNSKIELNELTLTFANTKHSISNLAIKIDDGKNTVCYSGDGQFTPECEKLYKNCDLVIHEAFTLDRVVEGHGQIKELTQMAKKQNINCLALTHIKRIERRNNLKEIEDFLFTQDVQTIIPEPFDEFEFEE